MAGMDLVWRDQPDYYNDSTIDTPRLWSTVHADARVVASEGYNSQNALTGVSENAYVLKLLPVSGSDTPRIGYRLRVDDLPAADKILLGATDTAGDIQVCVVLRTDGKLALYRGPMDAELEVSDAEVSLGVEYRLGLRAMVASSEGSAEAFLDGESILGVTGDNTAYTDLYGWGGIYIGLAPDIFVSHMYAGTGTGELPHDHMVTVRFPSAVGDLNEWRPSAGTIPTAIDDTAQDESSSYISSFGVADRWVTEMDVIDDHNAVYGLSAVAIVKNAPDSGSPSFQHLLYNDGLLNIGPWQSVVQEEWRAVHQNYPVNPFTGELWTTDELNSPLLQRGGRSET